MNDDSTKAHTAATPAWLSGLAGVLLLSLASPAIVAKEVETGGTWGKKRVFQQPAISIIIDDIGNLMDRDRRAIKLPGPITYAVLPFTPHAQELATLAHQLDKEVMLHLPMEAMTHNRLGPGGLTLNMSHQQLAEQLEADLKSVPYVAGINNHMGSLLTQHPGHMSWLMQELDKHELYFVDSYTTVDSVVQQVANEHWVPNLRRDVFLDSDRDPEKIRMQFRRLIKKAEDNGIAVGIGHPYPETVAALKEMLPELASEEIQLLPVSQLLNRHLQRFQTWRAFLSP